MERYWPVILFCHCLFLRITATCTEHMRPATTFQAFRATVLNTALLLAAALPIFGQSAAPGTPAVIGGTGADPVSTPATLSENLSAQLAPAASAVPASLQPLLDFRDSEVKFSPTELMGLLRDRRHEGWVLAAYPDPKTGRPLIGAGFSLDLPERQHAQTDPLNPHTFVEPSSAELWQAAGLDPARLDQVLAEFNDNLATWRTMKRYRRRIWALAPQITDDEASSLLRIAAIQAIENARAYCRDFDSLTGPQQMAVSQLVYQMGVNLGEFSRFLSLINNEPVTVSALSDPGAAPQPDTSAADPDHWDEVQHSLMQSQWARLYRIRAVAVIAMLDPRYLDDPAASEARIAAVLRPAVAHRRRGRSTAALRTAAYPRRSGHAVARKASSTHGKRKV